ncbi:MAG: hypothetical protein AMJ43_03050 [Coxiella sp. DG_40]|nr:MAG: hypothetical protein AMJ43_03050 [Coxiella sp. DG_40]
MRIKDIAKSILITICFTISIPVSAETDTTDADLYQVNIIVFEHITPQALNSEIWSAITDLPDLENSIEPQLLSSEDSQLQTENGYLSDETAQKDNYKVLLNIAWQQEIPVTQQAEQPIHILGDKIDGTITINKDRYFDIKTNLILTEPISYLNSIGPGNYINIANNEFTSFQMKQTRRLKSNELNYIDHPLFGMLIEIVPLEQEQVSS